MTAKTPEELRERMVEAMNATSHVPWKGRPDNEALLDAALSAADSAGFQLVPKEASIAMGRAGHAAYVVSDYATPAQVFGDVYRAMLAAAPKVEKQEW